MPTVAASHFDLSNLNMPEVDLSTSGMWYFDIPADDMENAPDAFQWLNEDEFAAESLSLYEPTVVEYSTFQADLDIIDDLNVPSADKKWMFDVLLNDVVPYRYHDHFRVFPGIEFYQTLLYNRPDRDRIWGLVQRFHAWIASVAAASASEADDAIKALEHRAVFHGWPGMQDVAPDLMTEPGQGFSAQQQDRTAPELSLSASLSVSSPSVSPMAQQGESSGSRSPLSYEDQHQMLLEELVVTPEFQFKGLILSMDHFAELHDAYERHIKRGAGAAPHKDTSWPVSSEMQREYVRQLFESITDLGDFFELRKARERLGNIANSQQDAIAAETDENPKKRRRGRNGKNVEIVQARPKGMSKTDWALVDAESSPTDLLGAVIHHRISGVEVELLCWRLLRCAMEQQQGFTMRPLWSGARTVSTWEHFDTFSERWTTICNNLQDCKMILHSLTRADWFCKYAGAPYKERGAKLSNDLLNGRRDIQNQVGRDVIKEKTSKQDWTTSDDFEIRDKEGELVLKGGHLGDKKRRELAVRSSDM